MHDRGKIFRSLDLQTIKNQIKPEIWLAISLVIPLYFGIISLSYGLSQTHIVQDDARIHVVWFQQFIDPQLFPDDPFAQYYQSIQSVGFKAFYWIVAKLGIAPMLFAKFLPTLLGLLTSFYCFKLVLHLLPIPGAALISTLILNQNIWLKDDLISATPRSFTYLLFTAFLYYLLRRSLLPCLITLVLQGLFYPQLLLVELGILILRSFCWQGRSLRLSPHKFDHTLTLSGIGLAAIVIGCFAVSTSQFGSLATAAQMKLMPEFGLEGRREYFGVDPISFWFRGASGFRFPLFPPIIWFSLGLPILLKAQSPANRCMTSEIKVLAQILVASLGLFVLAHLLFPKLYLPSRYTFYSLRVMMSIAAGIVLTLLLQQGYAWLQTRRTASKKFTVREQGLIGCCGLFAVAALVTPSIPALFLSCQNWIVGETPALYQFFARQPKDSLIASFAEEANNIPAFSQRSVLVSRELALPYHPIFYQQVKQRLVDLLQLQYGNDLLATQTVLQKYGIDFLLLEDRSFESEYLLAQTWLVRSSIHEAVSDTVTQLQQGMTPALVNYIDRCAVFSANHLTVVDAACLTQIESKSPLD